VSTTPNSIGYLSFGFLDDTTAPVPIDGVVPTVENVANGSYSVFRPLNMLTNKACDPNPLSEPFLEFVLSDEGQAIVAEEYIPVGADIAEEAAAPAEEAYTPPTNLSGQVQAAGSTTVQPLAEVLAEAFMELNPELSIEIQGGGSSVGVTTAGECTASIGNASRNVKDSEFETFPDLVVYTIANDGIAIVSNPGTTIASLSLDQVQSIFAGEITNFSEVGGPDAEIVVVSREEGSGTRAAFEELVMECCDAEKIITENALLQQSNGQVRTTLSTTPNSIGYLSFGFLDDTTSPVPIDGVVPAVENVENGSYSVFRPLNMLINKACDPNPNAEAYIEYILSSIGQEIVAEDYIPVK
jgi:phosphate transport system substrate-binding protein